MLYVGRYSFYFTTQCYTGILLFMAVRISKLVLQQAEKGFVSIVQHIGGFSQSVQRKMSNYEGCSLSTVHDIINIKWEVITKLHVTHLFHHVSKFQQNPPAY
jgi:hypothetical protein